MSGASEGEAKDVARVGLHVKLPDVDAVVDSEKKLANELNTTNLCRRASWASSVPRACASLVQRCSCTNCIFAD